MRLKYNAIASRSSRVLIDRDVIYNILTKNMILNVFGFNKPLQENEVKKVVYEMPCPMHFNSEHSKLKSVFSIFLKKKYFKFLCFGTGIY